MKNLKVIIPVLGAVFLMGLLALNMYGSTSLPGFGPSGGYVCQHCHNDVALAGEVVGDLSWVYPANGTPLSTSNADYGVNYVPIVNVDNTTQFGENATETDWGENGDIHFTKVVFDYNATHFRFQVRIDFDATNDVGTLSDRFAVIWNIDASPFSIGQFWSGLSMNFDSGSADMWFWDANDVNNGTGMADDMIFAPGYGTETQQDVQVGADWHDIGRNGELGYYLTFMRARETGDPQDVQFTDGAFIQYAIAYWNGSDGSVVDRWTQHFSSFDKALIVGQQLAIDTETVLDPTTVTEPTTVPTTVQNTVTTTKTETAQPSQTTSAFTAILVIATVIAIPVLFRLRRK
jgi:hypothetical protein